MKFKIDLNKLSDEQLENFLKLKKSGIVQKTNAEDKIKEPEKTKRELMLEELEGNDKGKKPDVRVIVPISSKYVHRRKSMDFPTIAKKMAQVVRNSTKEWAFKELLFEVVPTRKSIGGTDYSVLRPMLDKNLHGIRIVGKKRKYVSSAGYKEQNKHPISDDRRKYMSNKGKYVTSMAKRLISENPSLSWVEALTRSQRDFNEKHIYKKGQTVIVDKPELKGNRNFPHLSTIKAPKILKSIVSNLIQDKSMLTYSGCSYPLDLSIETWKNFCSEIILKSDKLSEYFGVANKFRLSSLDKNLVVFYG